MDDMTQAYSHVLDEVYQGVADTLDDICSDTLSGRFTPVIGLTETAKALDGMANAV